MACSPTSSQCQQSCCGSGISCNISYQDSHSTPEFKYEPLFPPHPFCYNEEEWEELMLPPHARVSTWPVKLPEGDTSTELVVVPHETLSLLAAESFRRINHL